MCWTDSPAIKPKIFAKKEPSPRPGITFKPPVEARSSSKNSAEKNSSGSLQFSSRNHGVSASSARRQNDSAPRPTSSKDFRGPSSSKTAFEPQAKANVYSFSGYGSYDRKTPIVKANTPPKEFRPSYLTGGPSSSSGPPSLRRSDILDIDDAKSTSGIDTTRPPSPREIAKAFEASSKQGSQSIGLSGRYQPNASNNRSQYGGQKGYLNKSPVSAVNNNDYTRNSSKSPELISPLEEFTKRANHFMENGSPKSQGKVKRQLDRFEVDVPPAMPLLRNDNENFNRNQNIPIKKQTIEDDDDDILRSHTPPNFTPPKPYDSNRGQPKLKPPTMQFEIGPGICVEGEEVDL